MSEEELKAFRNLSTFSTKYTWQIIDDIKEYLEETNKDQTTLDTLDLCHLIGEIEELNNRNRELFAEKNKLNNIINELEKEIDRLLERQYESERFAKEQGFDTYLPAKENLLCVKNKLQELKEKE